MAKASCLQSVCLPVHCEQGATPDWTEVHVYRLYSCNALGLLNLGMQRDLGEHGIEGAMKGQNLLCLILWESTELNLLFLH